MKKLLIHYAVPHGFGRKSGVTVRQCLPLCGVAGAFSGSMTKENVTCPKCKKAMKQSSQDRPKDG